jgi:demethylmenaquinone methyltransferase / 2-methoxy-6-polyprenyl-1,4-benzoquinol methylase
MSTDHAIHDFYNLIYKKYDLINRLFTFNNDQKWRRITAKLCLQDNPVNVLDLCCGTGDLAMALCKNEGIKTNITACDFNLNMLLKAEKKAKRLKNRNIRFIQGDASNLPFGNNSFYSITIGFGYRNLTFENSKASVHIKEISRVLKKGGKLLILESGVPENIIIRFFYNLYLRIILIPLGGIISGNWKAYKYLAYSAANFFNFNQMKEMLGRERLEFTSYRKFLFGAANLVIFTKN